MHQFLPSCLFQQTQTYPFPLQLLWVFNHKLPSSLATANQTRLILQSPSTIPSIQGMSTKKRILVDQQDIFGKNHTDSIMTRKKGKISDDFSHNCSQMRLSLDKWYCVGDLHPYNVITTIIKECCVSLSREDLSNLRLVNKITQTLSRRYSLGYESTLHCYASLD